MSVISKRFAEELTEKRMRDAYLSAQTRTKLTQQIREIRSQRGWSQGKFAEILGKPQSNVSRFENREYGNFNLRTLFKLASAFDCGLVIEFVPYGGFIRRTHDLSPENLRVPAFSADALRPLYEQATFTGGIAHLIDPTLVVAFGSPISNSVMAPAISVAVLAGVQPFDVARNVGVQPSSIVPPISDISLQVENERLRHQLQEEKTKHASEIAKRDQRIAQLEQIVFPNPTLDAESGFSRWIPIRGIQQQSLRT